MLYILKLENDKYYVGRTLLHDGQVRIRQHMEGNGCVWTQLYKPIEVFKTIDGDSSEEAENLLTLRTMAKFGFKNVRGGCWSSENLGHNPLYGLCYRCFETGHRSSECNNQDLTECLHCHNIGHAYINCPELPVVKCFRCNQAGHFASKCTKQVICFVCKKSGHISKECKVDRLCYKCNESGHFSKNCVYKLT